MDKELIAGGKFLSFVKKGKWEYVERPGVKGIVVILAITDANEILLTEQFRIPVDSNVIELPAGLAGDIPGEEDEELSTAAERELFEECGYEAGSMELLIEGPPSAGLTTEYISLFKASELKKTGEGGGDESENIIVHKVPLSGIKDWLMEKQQEGLMIDPKIFSGLYFLK